MSDEPNPDDCMTWGTCAPASAINPAGFPTEQVDNMGYRFWLTLVILVVTSGIFVAIRIATRVKMKQMGADDYFIIAAMISLLTQSSLWANCVRQGYGADVYSISADQRSEFLKYWWLGNVFFPVTSYLYKTSALLLVKRIFVQKPFQILCWVVFGVNTAWFLGNWFSLVFQCYPIPSMWGAAVATKCIEFNDLWISLVSWSVSMDIIIVAMPIPMIFQLHLKIIDKVMLMGLFLLGAIICVCSLMTFSAIVEGIKIDQGEEDGASYTFALANLFEVIESNIGVIGSCLPVLRILLTQWFPEWFAATRSKKKYYDEGFSDGYDMHNLSNKQKQARSYQPKHTATVASEQIFSSGGRHSDELGIIGQSRDSLDKYSGYDHPSAYNRDSQAIKKNVSYSVNRF